MPSFLKSLQGNVKAIVLTFATHSTLPKPATAKRPAKSQISMRNFLLRRYEKAKAFASLRWIIDNL